MGAKDLSAGLRIFLHFGAKYKVCWVPIRFALKLCIDAELVLTARGSAKYKLLVEKREAAVGDLGAVRLIDPMDFRPKNPNPIGKQ